jgi:hypothetical protein
VTRSTEHAAELDLDRLAQVQELLGPELRADPSGRVEEVRLVEDLANGLRLVEPRDRLDPDPVPVQGGQGVAEVGLTVADV